MKKIILLLLYAALALHCYPQDANVYSIYESQYQDLLKTRGVAKTEISSILKEYSFSKINNDSSLANILKSLYSQNRGIALLFYFFNNDTLRRAFYYPGKIVEIKNIAVKKEKLMALNEDINASMNLYRLSAHRSPQTRGVAPLEVSSKKISFEKAILSPPPLPSSARHVLYNPAVPAYCTGFCAAVCHGLFLWHLPGG